MYPQQELELPATVSGRVITNRGVHLQPFGHHGDWLNRAGYWVDLLVSMDMSWVVILTDSDSVRQTHHGLNPLKVLLDAGIIPIVREQRAFPHPFMDHDTFRWTVDLYGQYGLKPFWIIRNEPLDSREWVRGKVLPNAWDVVMAVWTEAAQYIAANGGYVGFPDGPSYSFNPFDSIVSHGVRWVFDEGLAFYAGHHYGKNRPRDYPYDAVTRHGAQLTPPAYDRLLDDFAADPAWREPSLEVINQKRTQLRVPGATAIRDGTCWRGWEQVVHWSLESLGYVVPMAMTEGGWVPRDRPGSGPNTDLRVPHTTPKMVAKKTLQMYDTPSPFFAICPWLLADQDMGGSGWPFDAWHGWAYNEKYGRRKPVITALQHVPAKEIQVRTQPMVIDIEGDTRSWAWARDTYGIGYRRGSSTLRLIEVQEYEGPASLDVWVVDSAGLPVEGVPFYYYHPTAPLIDRRGEWYPEGVLAVTKADGRLSFEVEHEGPGAIWPQGKGDLLEHLGLQPGTRNRRLNGMWQLVTEKAPLPPQQPGDPITPEPPQPPDPGWRMKVEHRPGPQIIAGTLPHAGIQVRVSDPWGNASTVISGSKPEHGPGGFEVLAPHPVRYTITFLDQRFEVPTEGASTYVDFEKREFHGGPAGGLQGEPPAELPPTPLPSAPAGSPEKSLDGAAVTEEEWALLLHKLERIEQLIAKLTGQ